VSGLRFDSPAASHPAQRGFSLVEVVVGTLIALLAVLVMLQVLTVAEGFKRNTTGAADAQQTGLLSTFGLGLELANAGNGIAAAGDELGRCDPAAAISNDIKTTLRPIPVLITDGGNTAGGAVNPDSLVVNYSTASRVVTPARLQGSGPWPIGSTSFTVTSPNGFGANDLIVGVADPAAAATGCSLMRIGAATVEAATGVATLTTTTGTTVAFTAASALVNMGTSGQAQRVLYDVKGDVLRSTDLRTAGATANPLASNVVLLKAQYGIDTDGDGAVDSWVGGEGDWAPASVLAMPMHPPTPTATDAALSRIKAVRVGVIVRSEQHDRSVTSPYAWVLFDCPESDKSRCPGRLAADARSALPANWRYRTYETVAPLRNQIWNPAP
jgi:type IV pilus assembly protein PilW